MSRVALAVASLSLLLTAAPPPSVAADADRVFTLGGTWACRTEHGLLIQRVGRRDGDLLDVAGDAQRAVRGKSTVDDRFTFDRRGGVWHVELDAGSPGAAVGTAPPWTGATWDVVVRGAQGDERARYELLADGNVRRTIAQPVPTVAGAWHPIEAELCAPGDAPPPADACIAENFPAYTISSSSPATLDVPPRTRGTVVVLVGLDEQSNVVSAAIYSSPSANLNGYALETARMSRFQTEIRNCRPIAARYLFSVDIQPRTRE